MEFILRVFHNLIHVHPPHLMVVHFPIALSGAALFFALLALWRRSRILEQVAFANLSLVPVTTVVAAALGIHDNLVSYEGMAPNDDAKILLAIVLFLVSTVTVVIRWKKGPPQDNAGRNIYVAAYFICFALAEVLGFLGGVIIYGF